MAAPCLRIASMVRSNRCRIDQRPHCVVHQDHIVFVALKRRERIAYGLLAIIAALDHMDPCAELVLEHLGFHSVSLLRPDGNANCGHSRHVQERLHRPHQHRNAANLKKLFLAPPSMDR